VRGKRKRELLGETGFWTPCNRPLASSLDTVTIFYRLAAPDRLDSYHTSASRDAVTIHYTYRKPWESAERRHTAFGLNDHDGKIQKERLMAVLTH